MTDLEAPGRVAYVLRKFPVLSETFILNELLAMEARGTPVEVFSLMPCREPRFHDDLPRLKARITYVPDLGSWRALLRANVRAARRYGRRYLRALLEVLATGRPGLLWRFVQSGYVAERAVRLELRHLHAHFANRATTVASLVSRITGLPYSFTAHAVDIYKESVNPRVLATKIEGARFVVTVSECNSQYLRSVSNGAACRIVRIYNGIDLTRFAPNGGIATEPFTILSVARLVEKKGLAVLVEACRHLREAGHEFQCWIVGKGKQRLELERRIRRWRLQAQVRLLGPHTQLEILERYHGAHLFALPCTVGADGNRDGLPVSIVEALACGLPVVTTSTTGIPEVVLDGHNGLIVPDRDPRALADAIGSLIADPARYARLCGNARSSVVGEFDREKTASRLQQLFCEGVR